MKADQDILMSGEPVYRMPNRAAGTMKVTSDAAAMSFSCFMIAADSRLPIIFALQQVNLALQGTGKAKIGKRMTRFFNELVIFGFGPRRASRRLIQVDSEFMAEVVHDAQHEFWRPPALAPGAPSQSLSLSSPNACESCGAEFIMAAQFCHVCGTGRKVRRLAVAPSWTRYFEFHNIKLALGLPLPSLIAFLVGVGCLLGAMIVGTIYAVQNFADFQAIQLWRMEWLLGAVAAFVAGILLKSTARE